MKTNAIILSGLDLRKGDVVKVETRRLIARYEVVTIDELNGECILEPFEYKS